MKPRLRRGATWSIRNKILLTFLAAGLLTLPAWRLMAHESTLPKAWWHFKWLFNRDQVNGLLQRAVYPLGISLNPGQVLIGRQDWLYLGNDHEKTLDRHFLTLPEKAQAQAVEMSGNLQKWQSWFASKGVESFKLVLGPDKSSIFPEHLPDWAKKADGSASDAYTDALVQSNDSSVLVDTRAVLLQMRSTQAEPLYYRTDTHWTQLAALSAVQAWAHSVEQTTGTTLAVPDSRMFRVNVDPSAMSGDLSIFLRMQGYIPDIELLLDPVDGVARATHQRDLETGASLPLDLAPRAMVPMKPAVLNSAPTLNGKRLLWLHDSFGSAMVRPITAMFPAVLHQHWMTATPASLSRIVEEFKPQLVLYTVVERSLRDPWFLQRPPSEP